jgi:hypothetical protein
MKILTLEKQLSKLVPEWTRLLISLKKAIRDDYRCTDDLDDNTPGMLVTIGFTPESEASPASWHYQTGDNSYSGGAYGHPYWGIVYLTRRSNSREAAKEAADEIANLIA